MSKNRLSEEKKMQAVMDLLSGKGSHSEVCARYGISQAYLYVLRDKALEGIKQSVGGKRGETREQRLEKELAEAKRYIGDQALVIEVLKKRR